jgi:hypothetical protein
MLVLPLLDARHRHLRIPMAMQGEADAVQQLDDQVMSGDSSRGGESTLGGSPATGQLCRRRVRLPTRGGRLPAGASGSGGVPGRTTPGAGAQPYRRLGSPTPVPSWGLRRVPQGCCRPGGRARSARQGHPRSPAGSPRHPSQPFPLEGLVQELRQQLRHPADARAWDDLPALTPKLG